MQKYMQKILVWCARLVEVCCMLAETSKALPIGKKTGGKRDPVKYRRFPAKTARIAEHPPAFAAEPASHFDVAAFCQKYALKRDLISRMISYAPRTVASWAAGRPVLGAAIQKVTELKR